MSDEIGHNELRDIVRREMMRGTPVQDTLSIIRLLVARNPDLLRIDDLEAMLRQNKGQRELEPSERNSGGLSDT
ncbi:hypothetical protein MUO32_23760 [Shinella sp. CPCC 101442]|uniref:hypothetical protein n=1 Tax=Shinella sp. CPCC 101442 TaxID=2932265 RepID=UPI002152CF81|nr:hypothetical protein [Shinella sp. CPCC 101442]MCR6502048.1 hypothetical protein [Shinella sp. CPCC 101442]